MKAKCIAFDGFFYWNLYDLAEKVYIVMDGLRKSQFDRLPKKGKHTHIIHAICKIIAGQRQRIPRAEIVDEEPLVREYDVTVHHFYSMSQDALFTILRGRYGVSLDALKKITVDDRVAGLVITKAPLCEYLADLTGRSRGGDRQALDASWSWKNAGLQLLHTNFIDSTVLVTIPPKWFEEETKNKIDEFMGAGTYDEHGDFDPNNPSRISLPWTSKDTAAIFTRLNKEYHVTIDKYTMGTGGGPGDDANFAAWQQQDECNVVRYTNQLSNIYLSVVHSWDKQFGFPFVSVKDNIPSECTIDTQFGNLDDGWDTSIDMTTPQNQSVRSSKHLLKERKELRGHLRNYQSKGLRALK